MKKIIALIAFLALVALPHHAAAEGSSYNCGTHNHYHWSSDDGVNIDFDNGDIIFSEDRKNGDEVRITEDYELYVNDELIKTDRDQKALLKEYYDLFVDVQDDAKQIGMEGAKIGLAGAGIGIKAVGSVFKLLRDDYDTDDLERDMEKESSKIEARAKELEKMADKLEDKADHLEDIQDEMVLSIPDLKKLRWF